VNSYFQRLRSLSCCLARTSLLSAPVFAQFPPTPGTGPGLPETVEAIENAELRPNLYVTAHPDDESAATLTILLAGSMRMSTALPYPW